MLKQPNSRLAKVLQQLNINNTEVVLLEADDAEDVGCNVYQLINTDTAQMLA